MKTALFTIGLLLITGAADAQQETIALAVEGAQGQSWSLSIQVLVLMTLLTLLPAAILSTSAFVRIIIVLSILRRARHSADAAEPGFAWRFTVPDLFRHVAGHRRHP